MKAKFYFRYYIYIFLLLPVLAGCSATQETTKETNQKDLKTESIKTDSLASVPATMEKQTVYIVQVGAFNTEEKAKSFFEEAKKKITREMTVSFSSAVSLFVVQVAPFNTKKEAEDFRNNLWLHVEFSDAFILTEER